MRTSYFQFVLTGLLSLFFFQGCFPTYRASKIDFDSLSTGSYLNLQAKLFTYDNSTILLPIGFSYDSEYISGSGKVIEFGSDERQQKEIKLPLDSIAAMITYEETTSGSRYFGSFLLGLTGPPLTFLGVYCLFCPKCCFGSCPTVYTFDGENYNLESELFSECISKQLEDNDLDLLNQNIINDTLKLRITNEALETHYINKFEIIIADHPPGTEAFPSIKDNLLFFSRHFNSPKVISEEGENITSLLENDDDNYHRSGVSKISELKKGIVFDFIDVTVPQNATKMILKYRNTLLSTTLLYDVVIASQGVAGLEWTNRMNENAEYAAQFKMVYDAFSGIKLKIMSNGGWKVLGKFNDAGPLNWKYLAAEIPVLEKDDGIIRLEFIPDNFMIDYIAFDTTLVSNDNITTTAIYPIMVTNGNLNEVPDLLEFINNDDSNYLITEPGDSYNFRYYVPARHNRIQTAFIRSKGYYNEWIRGGWITSKNNSFSFDLYDIQGTLSHLADSWLENSTLLETEFFNSRVSLRRIK